MTIHYHNNKVLPQQNEVFEQCDELFICPKKEVFIQGDEFFIQGNEFFIQENKSSQEKNNKYFTYNCAKKIATHYISVISIIAFIFISGMYNYNTTIPEYRTTFDRKTNYEESFSVSSTSKIFYIVQAGDTLWNISKKHVGKGADYFVIAQENKINNPDIIYPGDILMINSNLEESENPILNYQYDLSDFIDLESYSVEWIDYIIQTGDTLWNIAKKYMGNELGYLLIAQINQIRYPDRIFAGNNLVIPLVYPKTD